MTEPVDEKPSPLHKIAAQEQPKSRLKYAIGVVALVFVVIGWVGTNLLTNVCLANVLFLSN
jgi:hypothetical protein